MKLKQVTLDEKTDLLQCECVVNMMKIPYLLTFAHISTGAIMTFTPSSLHEANPLNTTLSLHSPLVVNTM